MNVFVFYRPNSEHERSVIDFLRDFSRETGFELESVSLDTKEGSDMARLYDVKKYPAVVALANDGQLLQIWEEEMLPTFNEISAYIER